MAGKYIERALNRRLLRLLDPFRIEGMIVGMIEGMIVGMIVGMIEGMSEN